MTDEEAKIGISRTIVSLVEQRDALRDEIEELKKNYVSKETAQGFINERDTARQIAFDLSEFIKKSYDPIEFLKRMGRGESIPYPSDMIAQVDLALGISGQYQQHTGIE